MYGVLIKTSVIDELYWLVKFYNNKIYYCHNKVLQVEDKTADYRVLSPEQFEMMENARYEMIATQHEKILKAVLFPLPNKVPSTCKISVKSIVERLKPHHPWLNENGLHSYIAAFQRKRLSFNKNISTSDGNKVVPSTTKGRTKAINCTDKAKATSTIVNDKSTNPLTNNKSTQTDAVMDPIDNSTRKKRVRRPEMQRYIDKVYNSYDSSDDDDKAPLTKKPAIDTYPSDEKKVIDKVLGKTRCNLKDDIEQSVSSKHSKGKNRTFY